VLRPFRLVVRLDPLAREPSRLTYPTFLTVLGWLGGSISPLENSISFPLSPPWLICSKSSLGVAKLIRSSGDMGTGDFGDRFPPLGV